MPDAANIVELRVGAERFTGWKNVRVRRSIERLFGDVELDVTDRWPDQGAQKPITPGVACEVYLGSDLVITGYIDDVRINIEKGTHQLRVGGRDKTADLADCSARYKSGQWSGKTILQIAKDLLKPFGLSVVVDAGVDVGKAFSRWNIQPSETVFECLERAARHRALLLTSNEKGDLVITRAGQGRVAMPLVLGVDGNIKGASAEWSHAERFSTYTVMSQGFMSDNDTDDTSVHAKAEVKDPLIKRYRPHTVMAEDEDSIASLKDRAQWEQSVRMGRGSRGTLMVQGWRHSDSLWRANSLVHVKAPNLALDAEMLISGCEYNFSKEGGTTTQLTICRRQAFERVEGVALSRLNRQLSGKKWREKKEDEDLDWGF